MALDWQSWSTRKRVGMALLAVLVVASVYLGYTGVRAWMAWRSIERVSFDLDASRVSLGAMTTTTIGDTPTTTKPGLLDAEYSAYLAIGSDERPQDATGRQEGVYADAIILYLEPVGANPFMVSLPRDLLVTDPCTGQSVKLNHLAAGCGGVSGPEVLAIAVEDFTGIAVDHFAVVRFDGLTGVIDGMGGIELCVTNALREGSRDILPAGCSRADGATVLRFVRSRQTQEFVDGEWRFQEGVSDLTRAQRQQQVLMALLNGAKRLRAPGDLADLVTGLADGAIVLDETLSMPGAVRLAWRLRSTPSSTIRRLVVPVESVITDDDSFAWRATMPFLEFLDSQD